MGCLLLALMKCMYTNEALKYFINLIYLIKNKIQNTINKAKPETIENLLIIFFILILVYSQTFIGNVFLYLVTLKIYNSVFLINRHPTIKMRIFLVN